MTFRDLGQNGITGSVPLGVENFFSPFLLKDTVKWHFEVAEYESERIGFFRKLKFHFLINKISIQFLIKFLITKILLIKNGLLIYEKF